MPSNNVFQYSKIRTRKRSAKKSIKTGKKNGIQLFLESGIQYPESGIHSMQSRIQDCPGFPYMGRSVTLNQDYLQQSITWQKERACNVLISEFPAPFPAIDINLNNFRLSKLEERKNNNKQNKT